MKHVLHGFDGKGKRRAMPAKPRDARPTKPARPAAKRKASKRAVLPPPPPPPPPPEPEGPSWIEWRRGVAIINLYRLTLNREVLAGVKTERCPGCLSVGIKVDEKWYHEVDVAREQPTRECELFASRCPECDGSGRVHR